MNIFKQFKNIKINIKHKQTNFFLKKIWNTISNCL